jgi:rare lipoprotein A
MKLLSLILFLLFMAGCQPHSERTSLSPIRIKDNIPSRDYSSFDSLARVRETPSGEDQMYSCLVASHGEIWMKPYEVNGRFFEPIADCTGFVQEGIASWYGPDFHGKKTSNGEIYDMDGLSAAHKTLPLGIQIRVTNLENGKNLIVRINDRGPYVKNRILDLSRAAAKKLGFHQHGTTRVRIEALGYPAEQRPELAASRKIPLPPGATINRPFNSAEILPGSCPRSGEYQASQVEAKYFVQVGAFENRSSATLLLSRVRHRFPAAVLESSVVDNKQVYCVRLKNFPSREAADQARTRLAASGFPGCLIVLEGFVKKV